MSKARLLPPCGYQGGKRKISRAIAAELMRGSAGRVYDFCTGSGAVSLSLIEAGLPAHSLTLVDSGPWGQFWQMLLSDRLDLDLMQATADELQAMDPLKVAAWLQGLAWTWQPPEHWLWLQAGTFGRLPVWWDGSRWRCGSHSCQRSYHAAGHWSAPDGSRAAPTLASPARIMQRIGAARSALDGAQALHCAVEAVTVERGSVVYVDPDYQGTPGYSASLPLEALLPTWLEAGCDVYCSEQTVRLEPDEVIEMGQRQASGLRGVSKRQDSEKLLIWRAQ